MDKNVTKIGKDVIESLTIGMYEDARFIYREYIQNSADQIDHAIENGLKPSIRDFKIEIDINPTVKTVSFFDNATGIKATEVQSILKNIAQSTKDRTKNKGFRGIGRLGGLGYCEKLVFETSFKGEGTKSYLTWDSRKLKEIINNRLAKEEATAVIDDVTTFHSEKAKTDSHYFKVTLDGVSNQTLLDKENIYQYLSMVAPVSFNKGFVFKKSIYDKANELNFQIDEYPIFLNKDQVFKSYTTRIYKGENGNKSKIDEVYNIETYEIIHDNRLLAWGWYSISKFEKMMPAINVARGIRLRKGNIQIGFEDSLNKLFKETRGSKYFFGEIHIVSPDLIPNARRDYFLDNPELKIFEKFARIKFDELYKLYYFASKVRNENKKIDDFVSFSSEYEEKAVKGGFTNEQERQEYQENFDAKKEKAKVAQKELNKAKEKAGSSLPAQKVFDQIVGEEKHEFEKLNISDDNGKTKYITDDISRLSRKERKLVSRIFAVIDNALPKDISAIVKDKIKEELQ